jgi:galactose oxidase
VGAALQVFVLGGSWSGPKDLEKDAEVFDPTLGTWTLLPAIQAAYILTDDVEGVYRADNYGWFFSWSNGTGTNRLAPALHMILCIVGPPGSHLSVASHVQEDDTPQV